MLLWFAFGSIFGVWNVFQSPGLDFRLIAVGALLPLALDAPFGAQSYAHTLCSAVVVFVLAGVFTTGRGRRLRPRRVLGLPIGWVPGLGFGGAGGPKKGVLGPPFGGVGPAGARPP